jgi:NAD(P)-dependent dehydrogenase (short-subunit alcohol dehydrogenase family)
MSEVHAAFGQIDVLINNAGGLVRHSPIVDASDDDIDAVFASTPAWLVQQRLMAVRFN